MHLHRVTETTQHGFSVSETAQAKGLRFDSQFFASHPFVYFSQYLVEFIITSFMELKL